MYQVRLEKFEGPLALLLQLIEGEKLSITEISLAQVTESYLAHLKEQKIAEDELADFLVIAAKLLLLKSKQLLPDLTMEEEGLGLEEQLRMYREYVEAAKKIDDLIKKKKFSFFRQAVLKPEGMGFFPPRGFKAEKMKRVFEEVLARLRPLLELPQATLEKTISIKEKIQQIQNLLKSGLTMGFQEILKNVKTRTEIIVSFLALLELVKQRTVVVSQESVFEEIVIKRK